MVGSSKADAREPTAVEDVPEDAAEDATDSLVDLFLCFGEGLGDVLLVGKPVRSSRSLRSMLGDIQEACRAFRVWSISELSSTAASGPKKILGAATHRSRVFLSKAAE